MSPCNNTSLPTTSAVTVSGYFSASATAVSMSCAFLTRLLPIQIPRRTFSPTSRCQFGHLVQAVVDGIGADAARYLGEIEQVFADLLSADFQLRIERRLVVAERRVGHAFELGRGIDRRAREHDRLGQPPPDRGNDRQRDQEKRQRRANGDWFYPPESLSIMVRPRSVRSAARRSS